MLSLHKVSNDYSFIFYLALIVLYFVIYRLSKAGLSVQKVKNFGLCFTVDIPPTIALFRKTAVHTVVVVVGTHVSLNCLIIKESKYI